MIESDVDRIESELNVTLPLVYRNALLHPRSPDAEGNDDSPLFDNANAIIELNRKYRDGFAGIPPWPQNLLFIGDDGAASTYSIDLSRIDSPVLYHDHGHPEKMIEECGDIASWIADLPDGI